MSRKDPYKIAAKRAELESLKRSQFVPFDVRAGLMGMGGLSKKLRRLRRPVAKHIQNKLNKLGF